MQTTVRRHNPRSSMQPSPLSNAVSMTPSSVRLATSLLRIATSLFLLISFHLILSGWGADGVTLRVVNQCPFPIWPAVAPNGGYPVLADGGFFLPPGQSRRVHTPPAWSGRLWARTGCDFDRPGRRRLPCETGDCQRLIACNGTTGEPPATIVEMTLQPDGRSYYDVSLVDGYNVAVTVSASPADVPGCFIGGCLRSPNMVCPPELQVRNARRGVVACKSACQAFGLDEYCCRNAFGSEDTCKPSVYSTMFKDACPFYYSYAFDTLRSQARCASQVYILTFCPPMATSKPM